MRPVSLPSGDRRNLLAVGVAAGWLIAMGTLLLSRPFWRPRRPSFDLTVDILLVRRWERL